MVLLHLLILGLGYFILKENKLLFIISEVLLMISALVSVGLYRHLIQPINQLREGISAIRDRDFNTRFLPTGKKEMDELIGVYNQMMDMLREERTRQEAQHFFLEKLIYTSPTGIIILDYDGEIRQINPKAEEILGTGATDFVSQLALLKTGESRTMRLGGLNTYKVQKSNFIDRGFNRVFVMVEEVTAEIFAAERNAYGKVIRMMAHEVNNTIGPVNSIISLALGTAEIWKTGERESLKSALLVAMERNHNLNLFMRNFADLVKLSPVNKLKVDLVSLLRSLTDFMQIKAGDAGICFDLELPDEPFYILADVQQMEQVLINVVKNAVESIGSGGRVRFTLMTGKRILEITDDGPGIPDELSDQLFSPFFSTKKDGQGIGLTLVREILLNHGFHFTLKTVSKRQTVFSIRF